MKSLRLLMAIGLVTSCERAPHDRPEPLPVKTPSPDPRKLANDEFEIIPDTFAVGTSMLYSRGDFAASGNAINFVDEGDFIGRLRTLFGPRTDNESQYVLRHRKTGIVITAYYGKSGAAYGGGPRYPGKLPAEPVELTPEAMVAKSDQAQSPIAADPELANDKQADGPALTEAQVRELSYPVLQAMADKQRVEGRRVRDDMAPPGFQDVAKRLDALISAAVVANWQALRIDDEDKIAVYSVGGRDGDSFHKELSPSESMAYLLTIAEAPLEKGEGTLDESIADDRAISYFIDHRDQLATFLPRLQKTWFRDVAAIKHDAAEFRADALLDARKQAAQLQIAPAVANAAISSK